MVISSIWISESDNFNKFFPKTHNLKLNNIEGLKNWEKMRFGQMRFFYINMRGEWFGTIHTEFGSIKDM